MTNAILNIGLNHETAPIAVRECLAKDPQNPVLILNALRQVNEIKEAFFLSTCNRVEVLCVTDRPSESEQAVTQLLSDLGGIPKERLDEYLFVYQEIDAVRHIFRIASSLDSMVVGEPQILGQIKEAYTLSVAEKTSGVILNRLLHKAFHAAKRVRSETGIADAAVSIAYAAVELAKKIFYDLSDRKVLLIGAGEMAELIARHLLNFGVRSLFVANRTFEKAVQLADFFKGQAVSFEEIGARILEDDIVIASTAAPDYIVTRDLLKGLMRRRRNRPLFFIDIAVPRNVEPEVNEIENVYLYDIDDLKGVVAVNLEQRRSEAIKAERIVDEETIRFGHWLRTLEVVPTIIDLKEKAEKIRNMEMQKSLVHLGAFLPEQLQAVETLTLSITEKILNDPILLLKRKAERPTKDVFLDLTRTLFNLDQDKNEEDENGSQSND
jgi:glutamyl-tRNA reductase